MDDHTNTLGSRLAKARKRANLTQADLGRGLGADGRDLQKGAVSAWEVGASVPSASQLSVICDRLGVSADYLLGRPPANAERKEEAA